MAKKGSKRAKQQVNTLSHLNENYAIIRMKQLEGMPLSDREGGSWPISATRLFFGWGNVTIEDWPKEVGGEDVIAVEPPGLDQKAKKLRLHHYQRVTSIEDVKRAIVAKSHPLVSLYATDDWFDAKSGRIPMPDSQSNFVGVHLVPILGYSDSTRLLHFINSWGGGWGDAGRGVLPYEYFERYSIESWLMTLPEKTRELAMSLTKATPLTFYRYDKPIELMWGAKDTLRYSPLHCREIYNLSIDERIGWAFAVQRDGFLDIEELFVRPQYRRLGYGRRLAAMLLDLSALTERPLRLWVSFADCAEENRSALEAILDRLGLRMRNTRYAWAAYVAMPGISSKPLEPAVIPPRPTLSRGSKKVATVILATSQQLVETNRLGKAEAPIYFNTASESRSLAISEKNEFRSLGMDSRPNNSLSGANEISTSKNKKAMAILSIIRERRKDRTLTEPGESLKYLREARSGEMYGSDEFTQHDY